MEEEYPATHPVRHIPDRDVRYRSGPAKPPGRGQRHCLDDKQAPAVGATIVVKGTNRGTIADGQGKFSIEASSRDTLQISLIGYLPQEIPVGSQAE